MRYEIRAMSFGEILDTGFRLVRDRFVLLVGLSAVMYMPLALMSTYLKVHPAALQSPGGVAVGMTFGLMGLAILVLSPIVTTAITLTVGETYLGRQASFGGSLRTGLSMMMPLMGTSLLFTLGILIGFLLLVIPGIYLFLAWILTWQVAVLERRFGFNAMRRSRELMRGNLLRGFGILFVGALIAGVLSGVLQLALNYIPVVGPIASGFAQAVAGAYTSTVAVLLYFDIRCRKEALDVEHLANLVQAAETGAPAPVF